MCAFSVQPKKKFQVFSRPPRTPLKWRRRTRVAPERVMTCFQNARIASSSPHHTNAAVTVAAAAEHATLLPSRIVVCTARRAAISPCVQMPDFLYKNHPVRMCGSVCWRMIGGDAVSKDVRVRRGYLRRLGCDANENDKGVG